MSAVLHCFPGRAAAPHWLFLPSWSRPLTQNTFAISFIPSPDGARRSFMRGLPKARTVTGRTSLPPTRRFTLPLFLPPPSFLPSSLLSPSCTQIPIWPVHQIKNGAVFLPCKSLRKTCHNPKYPHSSSLPPLISWTNCLLRHCDCQVCQKASVLYKGVGTHVQERRGDRGGRNSSGPRHQPCSPPAPWDPPPAGCYKGGGDHMGESWLADDPIPVVNNRRVRVHCRPRITF